MKKSFPGDLRRKSRPLSKNFKINKMIGLGADLQLLYFIPVQKGFGRERDFQWKSQGELFSLKRVPHIYPLFKDRCEKQKKARECPGQKDSVIPLAHMIRLRGNGRIPVQATFRLHRCRQGFAVRLGKDFLRLRRTGFHQYRLSGTPRDCILFSVIAFGLL